MYESSSQEAVCKDHKPPLGMTQAEVEEDGDQRQPPGFHMVRLPWAEDAVWPGFILNAEPDTSWAVRYSPQHP